MPRNDAGYGEERPMFGDIDVPGVGVNKGKGLFNLKLNKKNLDALYKQAGPDLKRRVADRLMSHNARMSRELAETAADILAKKEKRGRTNTGMLRRALLSRRNRWYSGTGFGVGIISHLDSSNAKYWRAIERGSSHFVGRPIQGIWAQTLRGGPYTGMGMGDGQDRFLPMRSREYARGFLARQGVRSAERTRIVSRFNGIIKNPIPAHRYLRGAWEQYRAVQRAEEAMNRAIREALRG